MKIIKKKRTKKKRKYKKVEIHKKQNSKALIKIYICETKTKNIKQTQTFVRNWNEMWKLNNLL